MSLPSKCCKNVCYSWLFHRTSNSAWYIVCLSNYLLDLPMLVYWETLWCWFVRHCAKCYVKFLICVRLHFIYMSSWSSSIKEVSDAVYAQFDMLSIMTKCSSLFSYSHVLWNVKVWHHNWIMTVFLYFTVLIAFSFFSLCLCLFPPSLFLHCSDTFP